MKGNYIHISCIILSCWAWKITLSMASGPINSSCTSSLDMDLKDPRNGVCKFYREALGKGILFFEGQRSGKLPPNQRVKWRADSALSDGRFDHVNLSGGYYDAGDNVKFAWPMSFSVTLLSWAAVEYHAHISSAHQLSHLLSAIHWGAKFILQSHTSPTTFYTQVGDGNSDHQCWERPEDMDTPRTLKKITAASPGTEPAADAAAALASAYLVFKNSDEKFAGVLLEHAKSLFEFANKYKGSYQGYCPFYCSYSGYQDELLWAASWLFKATKSRQYLKFVLDNQGWSRAASEFSWDYKLAGAQTLLAQEYIAGKKELVKYKTEADSFVCALMPESGTVQVRTTPGGLLFTHDAANLQYASSAAFVLFIYSKALNSSGSNGKVGCSSTQFFTAGQIRVFAKSQVDYILGKNPLSLSYMVGFSRRYPKRIHHRGSSIPSIRALPRKVSCKEGFSSWFSTGDPNPNKHVGAIVGGPDANDQFRDVRSDSAHTEPATYINAAFVGASAALLDHEDCSLNPPPPLKMAAFQ